jgi:hypothetical protein
MKSAYELAMERLQQEDPQGAVSLSDEQKAELAEIDKKFQARIAEKDIFLKKQIAEALQQGDRQAVEQLETQLRNERIRLEEERETAKEKIRQA